MTFWPIGLTIVYPSLFSKFSRHIPNVVATPRLHPAPPGERIQKSGQQVAAPKLDLVLVPASKKGISPEKSVLKVENHSGNLPTPMSGLPATNSRFVEQVELLAALLSIFYSKN